MAKNIQLGDTVTCTHAASSWFKVDEQYLVVEHPDGSGKAVLASDGFYDLLSMTISKFEKVTPNV